MRCYTFYNYKLHNGIFLKKSSDNFSEIELFPHQRYLSHYSLNIPVVSDNSILSNANIFKTNDGNILLKDKVDLIGDVLVKEFYLSLTLQFFDRKKVKYKTEDGVFIEGEFGTDVYGELKLYLNIPITVIPVSSVIDSIESDNFKIGLISEKSPYYFVAVIDFYFDDTCPKHLEFEYKINYFVKKDDDNRCLLLVKLNSDDISSKLVLKDIDEFLLSHVDFPYEFDEVENVRFLAYSRVKNLKKLVECGLYLLIMRYNSKLIISDSNNKDVGQISFTNGDDLVYSNLNFINNSNSYDISNLTEIF